MGCHYLQAIIPPDIHNSTLNHDWITFHKQNQCCFSLCFWLCSILMHQLMQTLDFKPWILLRKLFMLYWVVLCIIAHLYEHLYTFLLNAYIDKDVNNLATLTWFQGVHCSFVPSYIILPFQCVLIRKFLVAYQPTRSLFHGIAAETVLIGYCH